MTDFLQSSVHPETGSPRRTAWPAWPDRERHRSAGAPFIAPEIAFLASYGAPPGPLLAATAMARLGVTADQALLAAGPLREDAFYRLLARHLGVPYYRSDLKIAPCDPVDAAVAGAATLAPNAEGLRCVLAPRGRALARLLAAPRQSPPAFAIASPQWLGAALRLQLGGLLASAAANAPTGIDPAFSARKGPGAGQLAFIGLLLLCGPPAVALWPDAMSAAANGALYLAFGAAVALRLAATTAAAPPSQSRPLEDAELPVYSIIAPLRREAAVVARLIEALDAIDYPAAKLDIKIVVERDDLETLQALARLRLPSRYDVIAAPPGAPATKPRALNLALMFARGQYVVIYDAEDTPAADQLRRAAARFRDDPTVDCLQARLVIDNVEDSWLTRGFMAQTPQALRRPRVAA